jgi:(p)ppGpp synthase/HD superfamily hydrolase
VLTPRFSDALEYAPAHHAADLRKGTTIPYVAHLLAASALGLENGGDETAAVAALVQDVVEDRGGQQALSEIRERFGADVAGIVEGCSDTTTLVKEDWEVRETRYLEHLEAAPAAPVSRR